MERETIRSRHLPHWDVPDGIYFVTACLAGSIPAHGLLDIVQYGARLQSRLRPAGTTPDAWRVRNWKLLFVRQEKWLDEAPRNRALEAPALASAVVASMEYFAGRRYDLLAYVVMPSHFHWLFQARPEWVATVDGSRRTPRERIMYSLKRFTANACNRIRGVRGPFWQQESYDHWVRDGDELERIIHYIEQNPVKAGLARAAEDWRFSSARVRRLAGIELGLPLPSPLSGLES